MTSTMTGHDYTPFLRSAAGRAWAGLGARRRAGVTAPLFSLRSRRSVGVGELPDLVLLADWCRATGQSVIQLLPLNDTGYDFAPYSAQSSFALDPLYLALDRLHGVDPARFEKDIAAVRGRFAIGRRVDYRVKTAKMELLQRMFDPASLDTGAFRRFRKENGDWVRDYALYKALKDKFNQSGWESWPAPFKNRDPKALEEFEGENASTVLFHEWLQWQLAEQASATHRACTERGVYLMGDLPFLVARDSADVWTFQHCFKLDLSSGAPPDLYFAGGQRWGMPPYDWGRVAADGWRYLIQKLRCAERYYDLFRVDHVIGVFRLYTIPLSAPEERAGLDGAFDPADEALWEEHGRRILKVMLENTSMLPCGEDLGVVPDCSYKVLADWAIPGLDVQRWYRNWGTDGSFKPPEAYRPNAVAVVSTHDMSIFDAWWRDEAGTVDDLFFRKLCEKDGLDAGALVPRLFDAAKSRGGRLRWREGLDRNALLHVLGRHESQAWNVLDAHRTTFTERNLFWRFAGMEGPPSDEPSRELLRRALERAGESRAVFSIQLIQDYLSLGGLLPGDPADWRVNAPGSVGEHNWSCVIPLSLEEMLTLPLNDALKDLHQKTGRI
jgi:4-alpha-glucanotransferase